MNQTAVAFRERLAASRDRLEQHQVTAHQGLTAPDPNATEQWEASQVWAHLAEFIPYWIEQLQQIAAVYVSEPIQDYILDIVTATRQLPTVSLGASPRGSLSLHYASQAWAAIHNRDYVTPDDVKALAPIILAHRLIVRPEHRVRGVTAAACVAEALARCRVPDGIQSRR